MNKVMFLRLGNIVVNRNAIVSVHDVEESIIITLVSIASPIVGAVAESETIELVGDEAQAARSYFFGLTDTKKIF